MYRLFFILAFALMSSPALADMYQDQYKAVMARYFIANHYAVPIFTNGNIRKGDIIQYPDEGRVVPRQECLDLGASAFRDVDALDITLANQVSFGVGAGISVHGLAQIEAELELAISGIARIAIDPASREHTEHEPSTERVSNDEKCDLVRLVIDGRETAYLMVSDIIRGQVTARTQMAAAGGASLEAGLTQKRLQALLGDTPRIGVSVSGGVATIESRRSPSVRTVAVKSRFVSTYHLARLYHLYQAAGPSDLELKVEEMLTGVEPGVFERLAADLNDFLQKHELIERDKALFYNKMRYLETRDVLDEKTLSNIPQEHWRALGVIAAAHELSVW
ncbi:hypothetical protein GN330_07145 [Nitratireductor sp. CAU 1489]|uniref:Uncharacterized protein n=1 Tax=Nitratireductor arenosus TaxID=2682096 RepID=A0A844QCN3_9HYPH|nr:hypothetical protein [Nitratireductor arenosus]MVA97022.1 hypothetical protein [Nitratireductor arenosus]